MKYIFVTLLLLTGFAVTADAQVKPLVTAKISAPNVLCDECEKRLHTYLDRYDGIQYLKFNTRKGEITVKYLTDRINIEDIKTAISNAGYDADDVPAEEAAYKRLPKSCKKAADGGGHPIPKPAPPPQI